MASLNRVYLIGTVGSDPTLQSTRAGKPFCRISVATDNSFGGGDESEEKKSTDWHTVHVFGRQAELATQYLSKGRQVFVEGRIFSQRLGSDEKKFWRTWVNADRVTFLGGGRRREESASDPVAVGDVAREFLNTIRPSETLGDIPNFSDGGYQTEPH